jgi:hypothetical protein
MLVVTWRKGSAGRLPAPATGWWFAPRRSNGRAMCSRCCSRWRTAAMPFSGETRRAWRSPRFAACARTRTAALPGRRRPRPNAGEIEAPMPRAGDRRGKRSPAPDPRGCGLTYINVRAGAGRGEWLSTVGAGERPMAGIGDLFKSNLAVWSALGGQRCPVGAGAGERGQAAGEIGREVRAGHDAFPFVAGSRRIGPAARACR